MKLSFVIPAYNEEAVLRECLAALVSATKHAPCPTEIILVNNASTDNTVAIANSFPSVQVINQPIRGIVWARQAGFLASTGTHICNIDADTIMPEAWIATVVKEFEDPALVGLSGPYIYYDVPWYMRMSIYIFYGIGYVIDSINQLLWHSGAIFQGGNYIVRKDAFIQVGGFNTAIEFYGEDTDVGRRMRKAGKVKWIYQLPMYSSGRRFVKQGILKTGWLYAINFIWISVRGVPYDHDHIDIRIRSKNIS